MNEAEIREIFHKVCTALNDYQKGIAEVTRGIQRINARLKEFEPEKMSQEMDEVIEEYCYGMDNAGRMIEGLSERLRELNSFVKVIEDLEEHVDKFSKIDELLKNTENAINEVVKESSFWENNIKKINNYNMKMTPIKNDLQGISFGLQETPKGVEKRLENQINLLQGKIKKKEQILSMLK